MIVNGNEVIEMDMLDICIKQGYVPPDCKLDGAIAFMIVRDGKNPCDGCHADCIHKKSSYCREVFYDDKSKRVQRRKKLGTNSEPTIYVDTARSGTTITAILPNSEIGYIRHVTDGIECTADYIENMCIKYGAKQVIIDTRGFGIAVCDSLFNKKLPWLDIVPVHCISDR